LSETVWIALGVALVAIVIWRMMIPSLAGVIAKARKEQDITPIVEKVSTFRVAAQPAAYNHCIRAIWDAYDRELAIELIKVLAKEHSNSLIAQYWLKQLLQVEPALAKARLEEDFLQRYYQPKLAAQCGPVG
jgi:hypothetical protein